MTFYFCLGVLAGGIAMLLLVVLGLWLTHAILKEAADDDDAPPVGWDYPNGRRAHQIAYPERDHHA